MLVQENSGSNWDEITTPKHDSSLRKTSSLTSSNAQIVFLKGPEQQIPVTVIATGLTSPTKPTSPVVNSRPTSKSSSSNELPNDINANSAVWKPLKLSPAALLKQAAANKLKVTYLTHSEAIQCSSFDPNNDSRFKVCRVESGALAWVFTCPQSREYWVSECRAGLAYANTMAVRMSSRPTLTVDPACPLATRLITCSAVKGDAIIRGANRWLSVICKDPHLFQIALQYGCLRPAVCQPPLCATEWQSSGWHPISFSACSPDIDTLFLACVWAEAAECDPSASWPHKYTKHELATWVQAWKAGEMCWEEIEWAIQAAKSAQYKPDFKIPRTPQV